MIEIPFSTNQKFEGRREVYHTSGLLKIGGPSHFFAQFCTPRYHMKLVLKKYQCMLTNDTWSLLYPVSHYLQYIQYAWYLPIAITHGLPIYFPMVWRLGTEKDPMFWGHGGSIPWAGCLAPETPEPARSVKVCFFFLGKKKQKLVGGFKHEFYFPENIWDGIILPIHELIFFKMVKTTNQKRHVRASGSCICGCFMLRQSNRGSVKR